MSAEEIDKVMEQLDEPTRRLIEEGRVKFQAKIAAVMERGDWDEYLYLFESHEGLARLLEVEERLGDQDYWKMLGQAWNMTDVVFADDTTWRRLFASTRQGRQYLMTAEERARLAALPEAVTIHRGYRHPDGAKGLSWSLNYDTAVFFASEFAGSARMQEMLRQAGLRYDGAAGVPTVATATIPRERVLALLGDRDEHEVVVSDLGGVAVQRTTLNSA